MLTDWLDRVGRQSLALKKLVYDRLKFSVGQIFWFMQSLNIIQCTPCRAALARGLCRAAWPPLWGVLGRGLSKIQSWGKSTRHFAFACQKWPARTLPYGWPIFSNAIFGVFSSRFCRFIANEIMVFPAPQWWSRYLLCRIIVMNTSMTFRAI